MMKIDNYIRWFCFTFLSLFLVACKPTANFTFMPSEPSVGEVVKFDASKSTVYKAKEGNKIVSYVWNFGDNSQSTGQTTEHTYTTAGQYTVSLAVTDIAGQTNSIIQKITVKQGTTTINKDVAVQVQTSDGSSISNANVMIQGQSVKTDQNGLATLKLSIPQGTQQVVAKFEKEGFITQSIVYDVVSLKAVSANLLAIKQSVAVDDISVAQTIESLYLGATITVPANAFVKADGSVAAGAVTVEFTPWDITQSDLFAMPANGVGKDAQGNIANLISAGMITATFKDANGQHLQLAAGKTADIQMNLPLKSINNTEMKVGTQIPMWHFDETQGLWVEEGVGQVVASTQSSTGLAVHATVSHFSTWNWDFKVDPLTRLQVFCQINAQPVPCSLKAKVTFDDGSVYTLSGKSIDSSNIIYNTPKNVWIDWEATSDISNTRVYRGTKRIRNSGIDTVTIDLDKEMQKNYVSCALPDTSPIICKVTLENDQTQYTIPKDGAFIVSPLYNGKTWSAISVPVFAGTKVLEYSGTLFTQLDQKVEIKLTNWRTLFDSSIRLKTVVFKCSFEENCYVSVAIDDPLTWTNLFSDQFEMKAGEIKQYKLPVAEPNTRVSFFAGGNNECDAEYLLYKEIDDKHVKEFIMSGC